MALINRFTRLFRADLHAVLDRIEEPEVLLRQSVREMEQSLADDQRNLNILEQELEGLPVLTSETKELLAQVQEEINLCIDTGNDKLARSKVRRKLELQQRAKRLQTREDSLVKEVTGLREQLATNRNRLESMRQKLEIFSQEQHRQVPGGQFGSDVLISDDDVEVALLREKKSYGNKKGGAQ
jgi:phage shock protein A